MQYSGELYGKHGRKYFPMIMTASDVDKLAKEHDDMTKREKQLVQSLREIIEIYDRRVDEYMVPCHEKTKVNYAREILKQYETKEKKHEGK